MTIYAIMYRPKQGAPEYKFLDALSMSEAALKFENMDLGKALRIELVDK